MNKHQKKNPIYFILPYVQRRLNNLFPVYFLKKRYKKFYNSDLNLVHPKKLSEKMYISKYYLYPKNGLVVQAADKYTFHEFINNLGLENYLMPYLKVFKSPREIDLTYLPKQFVLKKTNASGDNLIVKDKSITSNKAVRRIVNKWMRIDFGSVNLEKHYSKSMDRIICEPYIENLGNEFRIFYVNGNITYYQIVIWDWDVTEAGESESSTIINGHRKHDLIYLDEKKNIISTTTNSNFSVKELFSNKLMEEMVSVSNQIAKMFPFVRVDFNIIDGKPKIMELTFTPAAGNLKVLKDNPDLDLAWGNLLGELSETSY